jgi:aldo/keto reductase family protein
MRYRLFGLTGLRVSELFLGAMTFGEQGGVGAPPEECARILDTCAEAGGNAVVTAVNYRGAQSEELPGQLLQGQRARLVLSTKGTVTRDRDDPNAAGNHRKHLPQSRSHLGSPPGVNRSCTFGGRHYACAGGRVPSHQVPCPVAGAFVDVFRTRPPPRRSPSYRLTKLPAQPGYPGTGNRRYPFKGRSL